MINPRKNENNSNKNNNKNKTNKKNRNNKTHEYRHMSMRARTHTFFDHERLKSDWRQLRFANVSIIS